MREPKSLNDFGELLDDLCNEIDEARKKLDNLSLMVWYVKRDYGRLLKMIVEEKED